MRKIISILFMALLIAGIYSCQKDKEPTEPFANLQDFATTDVVSTLPRIELNNGEITVYLSVTDQMGNPMTELNKLNFSITATENGVTEDITGFELNSTGGTGTPSTIAAAMTMDYSGSMYSDSMDVPNMEAAVNTFIGLKASTDLMELIKFSTNVQTIQGFTTDTALLFAAIQDTTYPFHGSTAFYRSLLVGLQDANDTVTNLTNVLPAIVGFTDGKNNQTPTNPDTVISIALQYQIPIYTVGYGSFNGVNQPDTMALHHIADTTGGRFFFTPTSALLQSMYQYINGQLTNVYIITFPWGNKANATIEVTTDYECGNGQMSAKASKQIFY